MGQPSNPPFIFLDPPDHDRLRRTVTGQFTPERVNQLHDRVVALVQGLLAAQRDRGQLDMVDDFAYPLPVTMICELLGVPRQDEPCFHAWATALARSLDPAEGMSEHEVQAAAQAAMQMLGYLTGLVAERQAHPSGDLIFGLVAGTGPAERMSERELLSTVALLLIAGHETTVNLVTNGTLALLRHPSLLERLRREPDLIIPLVEEVLRFDPPVQFRTRTTLTDISVAGVTIPRAATVVLLLASGSRDERRFPDADQFIPDRPDNAHLGFGGGVHVLCRCSPGPAGGADCAGRNRPEDHRPSARPGPAGVPRQRLPAWPTSSPGRLRPSARLSRGASMASRNGAQGFSAPGQVLELSARTSCHAYLLLMERAATASATAQRQTPRGSER